MSTSLNISIINMPDPGDGKSASKSADTTSAQLPANNKGNCAVTDMYACHEHAKVSVGTDGIR